MLDLFIVLGLTILYIVLSYFLFLKLEKKGVLPTVYDIYTGKKKKVIFFEFTRTLLFFVLMLVSIFTLKIYIILIFSLLFITQVLIFKEKMTDDQKGSEIFELNLTNEEDLYGEKGTRIKKKNDKIVLTKKYLYLGKPRTFDFLRIKKKRKIPLFNKAYVYIVLSNVERKDDKLIIRYGFLGMPMLKQVIFIPKEFEKKVEELIYNINNIRKDKLRADFDLEKKMIETFFKNTINKFKK